MPWHGSLWHVADRLTRLGGRRGLSLADSEWDCQCSRVAWLRFVIERTHGDR